MANESKEDKVPVIYLIGMIAVIVGFICPMFETSNGFDFINFDISIFVATGAIFILVGAIAGVIAGIFPSLKLLRIIAMLITVFGGIILVTGFMTNEENYKIIGDALFDAAAYGFYIMLAGWVIALVGFIMSN